MNKEKGLLLKLHCKVGDKVYKLWSCGNHGKSVAEFIITHIDIDNYPVIEYSMRSTKNKDAALPYRFFKDSDIGKGYLFQTQDNSYIAYVGQFDDDLFLSPQNIFIAIDKNTICRYTGKKDINKNKLYENDICIITNTNLDAEDGYFVLNWQEDTLRYEFEGRNLLVDFDSIDECNLEIYGNRFDNPEMIQQIEEIER